MVVTGCASINACSIVTQVTGASIIIIAFTGRNTIAVDAAIIRTRYPVIAIIIIWCVLAIGNSVTDIIGTSNSIVTMDIFGNEPATEGYITHIICASYTVITIGMVGSELTIICCIAGITGTG